MTNYWAVVSGKGNRIIPRWRPNKKRKGHLSQRSEINIYQLPPSWPPLVSHWSLPLRGTLRELIRGAVRKIIFCTGLTRATKPGQKSIVLAQGRTPFLCSLRFPICLSFNSQQCHPLSGISTHYNCSSMHAAEFCYGQQTPVFYKFTWEYILIKTVTFGYLLCIRRRECSWTCPTWPPWCASRRRPAPPCGRSQ